MHDEQKRPLKIALWDGFKRRCPNCHEGALFEGYLKVNDRCPSCGEDYTHQRADDGPAWATMLIVGHFVPVMLMGIYDGFDKPSPIIVGLFLMVVITLMTLLLLPRIKGMFVALQWANRMHGFGEKAPETAYKEPQE